MPKFKLKSNFKPMGDQPQAIAKLVKGIEAGHKQQTLLGVTGSGKTFTMANVIAKTQKPTLIISHNKTLAAQLAEEFKEFFPENAVHYFVSYYDYYQPEAYMPTSDTYIEKETSLNQEIERLRHATTQALLSRQDVIIVASVSCIYSLGSPVEYKRESILTKKNQKINLTELCRQLVKIQYERNDTDLFRGRFRLKGDTLDIFQPDSLDEILRLEFFDDKIEKILTLNQLTGQKITELNEALIFPATHYLAGNEYFTSALDDIRLDLKKQIKFFKKQNKPLEAERIKQRTLFDLEMIENTGYCNGIENYSRYFDGRRPGQPPFTLIDFFSSDFLMMIDESHMTVPQIRGMYNGDRARKQILVDYGFRLPSALDNRPLNFKEFLKRIKQAVYVSATPAEFEIGQSAQVVEQIIRPTGLLDPTIDVRPVKNQIVDLKQEINKRVAVAQRVLVTTLTKRMAEDLAEYLQDNGFKAYYLHSDIKTFERIEILQDLRLGKYDVVVGINLLREGLDLPEVSLVAILDADQEGFLRSEQSLIQTMGRAARHAEGQVIMYADKITGSIKRAIQETERRRKKQQIYNQQHNISPKTIVKKIKDLKFKRQTATQLVPKIKINDLSKEAKKNLIAELTDQMELAARNLEFEQAAALRDELAKIKKS